MPAPATDLAKALFTEIKWNADGDVQDVDDPIEFEVQFNPESLRLAYASTRAGGDQSGGSAIQYVGQGTTRLSLDLVFDASRDERASEGGSKPDVRLLTLKIIEFIKPKEAEDDDEKLVAPGLRISWGSFLFEGVVDSVSETLDYWSEDGRPLQARVSVTLSKQEVQVQPPQPFAAGGGDAPGTAPLSSARAGDSVAGLAGRKGQSSNWKDIAAANGIENPRSLAAGALLDIKAGVSVGATASLGLDLSAGVAASSSAATGFSLSAGGSVTTSASVSVPSSTGASSALSTRLTSRATAAPRFNFGL